MALSKKPVNGMRDILPAEMELRDYVTGVIKDTYRSFGFTPIETPCMENIANLSNKQGGENEKLIFKVLKRGEKLNLETATAEADVVDFGMRYDLTVPLSRYYANNSNNLPMPFKALQIGSVWRADRPQRGRYRQFTQCDIDIIGEPGNLAEIELITATTTCIGRLGFEDFEIHINDRRILKAMAAYSGFAEREFDNIFIILDKMGKIGADGVAAELAADGYAQESIGKYLALFALLADKRDVKEGVSALAEALGIAVSAKGNLESANKATSADSAVSASSEASAETVADARSEEYLSANATSEKTVIITNTSISGASVDASPAAAESVSSLAELRAAIDAVKSLVEIATAVEAAKGAKFSLVFDPTLVRGMSYYTGTIFEIVMPGLGAACGGGGRYDGMVGKFTGKDVPACGFSIGFERLILLLAESGYQIPERPKRTAYLVDKKCTADKLADVMRQAKEARESGQQVLVVRMNKNKKFQKEQLAAEGYEEFVEFFA